jgi:aromatic ring hydroxylase
VTTTSTSTLGVSVLRVLCTLDSASITTRNILNYYYQEKVNSAAVTHEYFNFKAVSQFALYEVQVRSAVKTYGVKVSALKTDYFTIYHRKWLSDVSRKKLGK